MAEAGAPGVDDPDYVEEGKGPAASKALKA